MCSHPSGGFTDPASGVLVRFREVGGDVSWFVLTTGVKGSIPFGSNIAGCFRFRGDLTVDTSFDFLVVGVDVLLLATLSLRSTLVFVTVTRLGGKSSVSDTTLSSNVVNDRFA